MLINWIASSASVVTFGLFVLGPSKATYALPVTYPDFFRYILWGLVLTILYYIFYDNTSPRLALLGSTWTAGYVAVGFAALNNYSYHQRHRPPNNT